MPVEQLDQVLVHELETHRHLDKWERRAMLIDSTASKATGGVHEGGKTCFRGAAGGDGVTEWRDNRLIVMWGVGGSLTESRSSDSPRNV